MNPLIGVGLKVLSALAFTLMSAGIKWVGPDFPTGQIVFFRSAFALVPLLVWLSLRGDLLASVRTNDLRSHIMRGLMGSCAMFAGFVSLAYLPLSDSVVIGYLSPLLTVVLAALFLGETVRLYRWTAVAAGFVGVVIMVSPHLGGASLSGNMQATTIGVAFGLLGACCAAGATIQVRKLTSRESTGAIVLYFTLLTTALGASTVVLGWKVPSASQFGLLVTIGILGGIGQILMTQSYRYADASLIAPFDYTTMIWAFLLGWFLFGQLPSTAVVAGGVIVAAAGLFVIWRERRLGLERAKEMETSSRRAT
ncbi:EamA family transporter [Enterovirga aerilata]|uniref:DMT family transporter n=1 Tax=Enterovirga aerilata TaxID=2730920 RepID=A0A849IDA6_9HYPH|nr:DMT family transporter [Enterovirga sp. DB1703]